MNYSFLYYINQNNFFRFRELALFFVLRNLITRLALVTIKRVLAIKTILDTALDFSIVSTIVLKGNLALSTSRTYFI